jgi:hypothetical protein
MMRRFITTAAFVLLAAIAAMASYAAPAGATSSSTTITFKQIFDASAFGHALVTSCFGEDVTFSGTKFIEIHTTGASGLDEEHSNIMHVTATGNVTGAHYIGTGHIQDVFQSNGSFLIENTFNVISPNSGADFFGRILARTTIDANGVPRVELEQVSLVCR